MNYESNNTFLTGDQGINWSFCGITHHREADQLNFSRDGNFKSRWFYEFIWWKST